MDTSTRLRGHGLLAEGKPYEHRQGDEEDAPSWHRTGWGQRYVGHGVCSCGAYSPALESDGARKRWHKAHKDEIRSDGKEPRPWPYDGPEGRARLTGSLETDERAVDWDDPADGKEPS